MRIVFVRHGHPNYKLDCLTELGHLQAAAAAERLSAEGIETIYSSTCGRAYETAQYTANRLGLEIIPCDFMREISWGSADGEPLPENGHPWHTAERMAAESQSLLEPDWMDREPFARNKVVAATQKVAVDIDAWLLDLGYRREGRYYRACGNVNTHRTVAAFGHGGLFAAVFSHLFSLPFPFACSAFTVNYTSVTVVTLADDADCPVAPQFEILNDARHIAGLSVENVFGR